MKKGLWILLMVLAGCMSPKPHPTLVAADSIMETASDSALTLLEAVDCSTFTSADSDYYALLLTQAMVKERVEIKSDSLIKRACKSYYNGKDEDKSCRSFFYAAQVSFDAGRFSMAMRPALQAYVLSQNNAYWQAKSAELIADIFAESYNYDEEAKYRKAAVSLYKKAGKERNHYFALCDLVTTYNNKGDYTRAIHLSDSIREVLAGIGSDTLLQNYYLGVEIPLMLSIGKYNEADNGMKQYRVDSTYASNINAAITNSYIAAMNGKESLREEYLLSGNNLIDNDRNRVMILYARYDQAFLNGDYKTAAELTDTLLSLQSKIAYEILRESVMSVQRDFYSEESEKYHRRTTYLEERILLVSISAIVLIFCLIVVYRLKLRAKQVELELRLKDLMEMQRASTLRDDKIAKLFKDQWHTLNELCACYFDLDRPEDQRIALLKKIEKVISAFKKPKSLRDLETVINQNMNGVMQKIRHECDFLNEREITFLIFLLSGFSAQLVCLIIGIKYKNFYLKKSRLIKKIAESSAPNKEYFLHQIAM